MTTPPTTYVLLSPRVTPFDGRCPACGGVMDDTGCRIGPWGDRLVRPEARARTGIARVVEILCRGRPTRPVTPCPACSSELEEDL